MIILRDDEINTFTAKASVATIGVFDGLHRGHQAVIGQVIAHSKEYDARSTVVTFDPSPAMILAPTRAPRLLATLDQRLEGIEALGVDQVRLLTFNATLAHESARHFVERVLVGELRTKGVVVGEDFHFGHNREGTVATLGEVGAQRGFSVWPAPLYGDGERWRSTSVRAALARGDLEAARSILGRPFTLRGTVVHGDERGEELGYPTANLDVAAHQQLPAEGVYAGATTRDGKWWPAAISVGTRPQFYDHGELVVEVHVLGFEDDLYDSSLDVVFLARLRAQMKFSNVDELTAQIELDVVETRKIFNKFRPEEPELLGWTLGQRR
jgi:riboflavin kinase/FMN adenylyltransferase